MGTPQTARADVERVGPVVPDELLFHVTGSMANRAVRVSPADAGLQEREHLQELLLANSDVISSDMLIPVRSPRRWVDQILVTAAVM